MDPGFFQVKFDLITKVPVSFRFDDASLRYSTRTRPHVLTIHVCFDHCTPPYLRPHSRQVRLLTTRGINLLTATVRNEIKSNGPRYRPYDDSVIPCYDMMILLYHVLMILPYSTILTIILHRRSCDRSRLTLCTLWRC